MKKRWLCLFVENEIGVLARISGLFSSKSYNLDSLTVGTTEDETISRMTISIYSDDQIFEQIKKQLNRTVEVIKVIDYTDLSIYSREIMFLKIKKCTEADKTGIFRFAQVYNVKVLDFNKTTVLLECVQVENENDKVIKLLSERFDNPFEIIRGGSVAIEAV
ncbi:acetolactate synthase small subunit [Alkalibaculum sp. M08DMB]|uniref:Acetolactate synthase small subunit n=1 Tax=Alkalibaculum sporogenes TaxID=2655001 RepID=A0A6A7K531_9FIRM|nr:acetolactate synthase small subunit [Alkalibaculum sporogenes]